MKITIPPVVVFCLAITLFSCAAEDMETETEELKAANLEVYQSQDLEGIWELYSMHSDVAVDFNNDGISNKDIKVETDCFDVMFYEFKPDNIVNATQSKLYINTTGIAKCNMGNYSSTYSINGDQLTVTFRDKDGVSRSTTKQIELKDEKQFLHLTLTRLETAGYINDDSGNSTEVINSITTVYKKKAVQ